MASPGVSLRSRVLMGMGVLGLLAVFGSVVVTFTVQSFAIDQVDQRLVSFAGGDHHQEGHTLEYYLQYADRLGTGQGYGPGGESQDGSDDAAGSGDDDAWEGDDDAPATSGAMPETPALDPDMDFGDEAPPSDALRGVIAPDGTFTVLFEPNVYAKSVGKPVIDLDDLSTSHNTYLTVHTTELEEYRVLAQPLSGGGWEITALSMHSVAELTRDLVLMEIGGVTALLMLMGLLAWWVVSLGINPMRRMVDVSSQIAQGDLSVRLPHPGHGLEVIELSQALNTMIGTIASNLEERQRSEQRLRTFVADASHELRTPLTTVLGYAQLHRKGALADAELQDDAWNRTEAEASRMRRLVEDMLELARYDAEPQLQMSEVDVHRMAQEVLADATRAHAKVEFALEESPVEADIQAPVTALVDADRLRQAIINLVNNAAQHGAHHVTVTVSVVAHGEGPEAPEFVHIAVADDGPGMTPEVAARATERFVRGDASRARKTGGAGLGLAITAAIVDVHGGELTIDSVLGEGSTITIAVPV